MERSHVRPAGDPKIEVEFGIFGEILEIWYLDPYGHRLSKMEEGRWRVLVTRIDPRTGETHSRLEGPGPDGSGYGWMDVAIAVIRRRVGGSES